MIRSRGDITRYGKRPLRNGYHEIKETVHGADVGYIQGEKEGKEDWENHVSSRVHFACDVHIGRYRVEALLSAPGLGGGKRFTSTLAFMGRCNHRNRWSHHLYNHAHQRMDIRTKALAPNACPVTTRW